MPECTCQRCVNACKNQPGWFMPGEAEKAAELLQLPFQEFFDKFLSVDYWVGDPDILVLTPSKQGQTNRKVVDYAYAFNSGTCIFLDEEDRCKIHAKKPYECVQTMVCSNNGEKFRREVKESWNSSEYQASIETLLDGEDK